MPYAPCRLWLSIELIAHDGRHDALMALTGVPEALSHMLADDCSTEAAGIALAVLSQIALAKNVRHINALVAAGVLPGLVALLHFDDGDKQGYAALTLSSIGGTSDALRRTVIDSGAVPALARLLPNSPLQVAKAILGALTQVRFSAAMRVARPSSRPGHCSRCS